jgi:hypothetical protein
MAPSLKSGLDRFSVVSTLIDANDARRKKSLF